MRVFRSVAEIPDSFGPSVVTIGNFDGVHQGHRELMRRAVAIAKSHGFTPIVMTFDPHPARVLAPERAPKLLMTIDQRLRSIEQAGIEATLLFPFSVEFARVSPDEFARQLLAGTLHARAVLVGEDFRYGRGQAGSVETLRAEGRVLGFDVEGIAAVEWRGARISSTSIRRLIRDGCASRACRMLGAPFALEGEVVRGQGIGSKQTVPTLNLKPRNEVLPKTGVYVTRARDLKSGHEWASITNVGYRPTFGGDELTVETFLLDPFSGPPPENIEVSFLFYVREETKFETADALKAQILKDVSMAKRLHGRLGATRVA